MNLDTEIEDINNANSSVIDTVEFLMQDMARQGSIHKLNFERGLTVGLIIGKEIRANFISGSTNRIIVHGIYMR
jgi:hypothetical protein